jgi:hypothetical protein
MKKFSPATAPLLRGLLFTELEGDNDKKKKKKMVIYTFSMKLLHHLLNSSAKI